MAERKEDNKMAKRSLAAGFRKRKDGKYESRFTLNGKRYSVYGNTLKECKEKDSALREQIRNGLYTSNRNLTLEKYYQEWKLIKTNTVKSGTMCNIETHYKLHILPALGSYKLYTLERRQITKFQQELAMKFRPSTVNLIMVHLKNLLNDAVSDGVILRNPSLGIKPVKEDEKTATQTYHRALTEEEQRIFMEYAREEWLYELLALLLCTGMRIGEATALTWQDIDYVNHVIHVTKSVCRKEDGRTSIGSPKSRSSVRDIPLNTSIQFILKSQKEKQQLADNKIISMSHFVFTGANGGMLFNSGVNRAIHKILERMQRDGNEIEYFSVHALRDTFATRYIEQGGSPQVLKTILGHSSLSMTMDLYSQVMPNTKQQEMDNIKIAF